ncbi:MAG: META domain-containing protein [Cyanobacteria bacterium P01_F01_bin.56]
MNSFFRSGWGRSLALTFVLGSSVPAIALPSAAQSSARFLDTVPEMPIALQSSLEQSTWQLVSYRDASGNVAAAWGDRPATFQFAAGQLTGTTGCNRFFSSYTVAGDELAIADGGSTLMACFPEALAQQEAAIFTGMAAVTSYDRVAGELQLLDRDGDVVLTLTPQVSASLTNTPWTLTAYNNGRDGLASPVLDTEITANFDDAGLIAGSAGCNTYRANFESTDNTLQVSAAASTRRLCSTPDGAMQQEQTFLELLAEAATYDIDGHQLTLRNSAGTVLAKFVAAV